MAVGVASPRAQGAGDDHDCDRKLQANQQLRRLHGHGVGIVDWPQGRIHHPGPQGQADKVPEQKGEGSQGHHPVGEVARNYIRQPLDGGFAALGRFHQLNHLGQHRVVAGARDS